MILSRAPLRVQAPCVRLACIRHAASVHPEPGSNSPPKLSPRPPKGPEDFVSHLCVRRLRCACLPRLRKARLHRRVGPPSSAAHYSVPPGHRRSLSLQKANLPRPSRTSGVQPVNVPRYHSAHEQKKTAQFGRAALCFDTSASQLRSSLTIYKATPSGYPLAPDSARVSSC